jgi:hypothetical protein
MAETYGVKELRAQSPSGGKQAMLGTSEARQPVRRRETWHGDAAAEAPAIPEQEQSATRLIDRALPIARFTPEGELQLDLPSLLTPEQIVFLAELRSLAKRVQKSRSAARQEVLLLLENAANAAVVLGDLDRGEAILGQAGAVYERALVAKNRLNYVLGMGIGLAALTILVLGTVGLAQYGLSIVIPGHTIVTLFAFAGLGSVTSVLIRLSTLDLKEETSRVSTMVSGASKPVVAIAFASIVYIVLKYKLIAVTIGTPEGLSAEADEAAYWIAAFLCGFSERFGSDIISRPGSATSQRSLA